MYILGISAFYHNSAVCIVKDGNILAAAQEEQFTRKKHDHAFPVNAIKYGHWSPEMHSLIADYILQYFIKNK